jgi:RNA polymerase sigma-70 factor (ECF subfamily)
MFERHYAAIRRLLRYRLRGSDWADDLVQETYARVLTAHAQRPVESPQAFLVRTATNLVTDFHRGEQRKSRVIDPHLDASEVDLPGEPLEDAMTRQDELARLQAAIEALPSKCRRIFVLHKIEGYSQGEIASRFGISVDAVEKHVGRAMVRLRRTLTGQTP